MGLETVQNLINQINNVGQKGTSGFSILCRCKKSKSIIDQMSYIEMHSLVKRLSQADNSRGKEDIQQCELNPDGTYVYHVSFCKTKSAVTITNVKREEIQQEKWKIANFDEYEKKLKKAEKQLNSDNVLAKVKQSVYNAQVSPCKDVFGYDENVEQLSNGLWSRRINQKHRLVYEVNESNKSVKIISVCGHYPKMRK